MSGSDVTAAPPAGARPIEALRAHPEWYFRGGRFDAAEMLGLLVSEATALGADDVAVRQAGGWWTVASTHDWLGGSTDAFAALVSDPALGPNTSFVEVLLTAFCPDVWTASGGEAYEVTATGEPPVAVREVLGRAEHGRVVAFRVP
jgi:hypothetical protein